MANIIDGYEYDIFISYRQNDNHSGWVTKFVEALKEELTATLKKPFSIYFDANSHNGLLETHNIDKSLEGKLKCLIFIPIISHTYCDPQSYAWQHEFCVFNKMAKENQFGLNIKLSNGNVTSRILPVKIHELDSEDNTFLKNELGEVLRAIEFIFKSPGVNRPLTSFDNADKNQNQTLYRDQINKVANAVKEILKGVKNMEILSVDNISNEYLISQTRDLPFRKKLANRNVLRTSLVYILVSLVFWKAAVINSDLLNLTRSTIQLITIMLIVLFPFATLLAWLYERSPQGFIKINSIASIENSFTDNKKKPFTSNTFISLLLFTIATLFLLFPHTGRTQLLGSVSTIEKSIAILPFINDSPDQDNSYFINGIMEEVLDNLQKIKDFRVLSRTSTEQYTGKTIPMIPEIAKKLGVNFIVEGSGQKYSNKFVLRVQLIVAKNEKHIWGKSYEQEIRETSDFIKIQSEIAQSIAAELKATITPEEKHLIEKTHTTNLTAYDFYQRGREEYVKYWINNDNRGALKKAEELYHKALKNDTTFAQAYSGLAMVYWKKHYYDEYFSKTFMDSVQILANMALSHDNELSEAYDVKGEYYAEKGLNSQAIEEYDKAIIFNPNDWMAYFGKGSLYGDNDNIKTIENLQKAASLNHGSELPLLLRSVSMAYDAAGFSDKAKYYNLETLKLDGDSVLYYSYLSRFERNLGNFENALKYSLKVNDLDPTNVSNLFEGVARNLMFLGRHKESLKYYKIWFEKMNTLGQFDLGGMHRIGYAYWRSGNKKEAEDYFNKQIEYCNRVIKSGRQVATENYTYYDLAAVYAFRGDKKNAYKYLHFFDRSQVFPLWVVTLLKNDPLFNSFRNKPEFQQIVKAVESKYQAEHERVGKWINEQGIQ